MKPCGPASRPKSTQADAAFSKHCGIIGRLALIAIFSCIHAATTYILHFNCHKVPAPQLGQSRKYCTKQAVRGVALLQSPCTFGLTVLLGLAELVPKPAGKRGGLQRGHELDFSGMTCTCPSRVVTDGVRPIEVMMLSSLSSISTGASGFPNKLKYFWPVLLCIFVINFSKSGKVLSTRSAVCWQLTAWRCISHPDACKAISMHAAAVCLSQNAGSAKWLFAIADFSKPLFSLSVCKQAVCFVSAM